MALRLEYTLVHNSFKQLASASAMSSSEKLPNQIQSLGGGFEDFSFSPLFGEMMQFDKHLSNKGQDRTDVLLGCCLQQARWRTFWQFSPEFVPNFGLDKYAKEYVPDDFSDSNSDYSQKLTTKLLDF